MVAVIHGDTYMSGIPRDVSLDLICIAISLNQMKKEELDKYNSIRHEFIHLAKEEKDKYLYSELKEFVENLKDFFE